LAEIIQMNPDTLTVDDVLKRSAVCERILVLGLQDENNDDMFFAMSGLTLPEILFLMEKCKHFLMNLGNQK